MATATEPLAEGEDAYILHGLNFSPYTDLDEDPDYGSGQVTPNELQQRMEAVSPKATWLRTFGCTGDLEEAGRIAHELGNSVAVGAWINSDLATNETEIDSLVEQAIQGHADMVIVGSEVLYRDDVPEETLIGYINDVKGRLTDAGISIPVTTADIYGSLLDHPAVIDAVDVVLANYYPFWERVSIDTAVARLHRSHLLLQTMAGGKEVIVSETGWPSDGEQVGDAVPSPENAAFYFLNFVSWARDNNVKYFYFEAYDEPWKIKNEGSRGAHWGIFSDTRGVLKPGMEMVFRGNTVDDNWSGPPGGPIRDFFSLPVEIHTNIDTFLVAGVTELNHLVKLNGTLLPSTSVGTLGEFSHPVQLVTGENSLELTVVTSLGEEVESVSKTVIFDPDFSTDEKRLLYIDAVPGDYNSPEVDGTIVIDLDGDAVLGLLEGLHVRGVSASGSEIYMHDRTVINTGIHQPIRTLGFSQDISGAGFLVSPIGTRLYSQSEVLDLQSNMLLDPLAADIVSGSSWSEASIPGGPAITADGTTIYAGNTVARIELDADELDAGTVTDTGVVGYFMSDIEVSPDSSRLLISEYSNASGRLDIYRTGDFALEKTIDGLGDFAGEISFLDNETLVVGSAGNSKFQNGVLSLVDLKTMSVVQQVPIPLADNVATSKENREVFVSTGTVDVVTGSRFGVDVWVWGQDGKLFQTETFSLGINGSISVSGRPEVDQIRDIVYKPPSPRDFGDAPDPTYPTLLNSDGARHLAGGPLWLGSAVDTETDAQPHGSAEGDDLDAQGDDEDGVVFTSPLLAGQTATVDVTVSTGGFLNAWIDFNADGDWDDSGEQIFVDVTLADGGAHSLAFGVPAGTPRVESFARFRISTAGGLSYDGLALDGEVEDYMIPIAPTGTPDLVAAYDTGQDSADDITSLDNGSPSRLLEFVVGGTVAGATVVIYADGTPIGSLVASGTTTRVATDGTYDLADGTHVITARQTQPANYHSNDSFPLSLTVDTLVPTVTSRVPAPEFVIGTPSFNVYVTFSETVHDLDATELVLGGSASGSASVGTPTPQGNNTWQFPIAGLVEGTLNVSLAADPEDIVDTAGNGLINVQWSYSINFAAWQNPGATEHDHLDVNGNGYITPLDALLVINDLNRNGHRQLPTSLPPDGPPPPYVDVNGDGYITPLDALLVINFLNKPVTGQGELSWTIPSSFISTATSTNGDMPLDQVWSRPDSLIQNLIDNSRRGRLGEISALTAKPRFSIASDPDSLHYWLMPTGRDTPGSSDGFQRGLTPDQDVIMLSRIWDRDVCFAEWDYILTIVAEDVSVGRNEWESLDLVSGR
ncbi:MAG: dockerin type I domain-containing protein [Pirellulaceae bacterium]